jgi:pyochelin synthetase
MTVSEVISKYEAKGAELWEEDGQIRFRAPSGVIDEEAIEELRHNKEAIIGYLRDMNHSAATGDLENRYAHFPLTDIQTAYLVGRENIYELGGVGCHGYIELTISEILDRERLEKAWHSVIERHDMLRAVILTKGFQQVRKEVELPPVQSQDLRGLSPAEAWEAIEKVRKDLSEKQYSPEQWPLCEIYLTITEDCSILHFSIDMLIGDFVSANIILRELDHFYYEPEKTLPKLEVTFRDLLLFQREKQQQPSERAGIECARKYWMDKIEKMAAAPELPVAENNQAENNNKEDKVVFEQQIFFLDKNEWQAICRSVKQKRITPSSAVLSAFAEVIGLWAKRPEFCINITLLNRPALHTQINDIIGDFTAINILQVDLKEGNTFLDRTENIQRRLWQDLEHNSFSGIEVLREMSRRNNKNVIIPVVYTSTIGIADNNESGDFMRNARLTYKISQTPQVWLDCQVAEQGGGLLINWDVRKGIFPEGMIEDAFEAFKQLLCDLAAGNQIWENRLPLQLPPRVKKVRETVNNTNAPLPDGLLHDGFCSNVKNHPEAAAVFYEGRYYSYRELANFAAAVQKALLNKGFGKGDFAAVILEKGIWQIASVLGILLAGGVYLPVDTSQPKARQNTIIKNSGTRFVLTGREGFEPEENAQLEIIEVDVLEPMENSGLSPAVVDPLQPAYIIHTSGTTGTPKGVVMNHRGALNTIIDINERFHVNSADRIIGIASLAFDLSVYDIFGILTAGGTLVLPDPKQKNNPDYWAELIIKEKVTVWNSVPAQMQMLMTCMQSGKDEGRSSLRLALLSGDWIPVNLPGILSKQCPGIEVISLGGATEAAIWSIYYPIKEVPEGAKSVPYGTPLLNQRFYVMNKQLQLCPDWTAGDLYIGGEGLALGYLDDAKTANERFIIHPETNERLYYTGDLGRYRPDGVIEFLGREDTQVKIRGHRIELSEIESVLQNHPSIASAVAMVSGNTPQEYRINAFVEASRLKESDTAAEDTGVLHDVCFNAGEKATASVDRSLFAKWIEVADQTTLLDIIKTFRDAGLFQDCTASHSNEEIQDAVQAVPKLHRLLRRWLNVLCAEKFMQKDEITGKYSLLNVPPEDAADRCWERLIEIEAEVNYGVKLVHYLRESSKHLPELLRGDVNALDLFFPQGKLDTALAAYHDNLVNLALNCVAKECVVHLAEERMRSGGKRPLRILEVGAGVGGTSIDLIPALVDYNVEYHFTDISTFFLNEAKSRFGKYSWVSYGLYDINKDYWLQGLEASAYDVIVCANVLHNARNVNVIIEALKELAVPGGKLIVIEATKEAYTLLTSMEFKDGLTGFTDFRASTDRTFIDFKKWKEVFDSANAGVICAYPKEEDPLALAGQTIFICGFPAESSMVYKEEIKEYLQQHLPEYMVPGHIEVLPKIPLSGNGKVDRASLKKRMEITIYCNGVPEEAPQDDLEARIAGIWAAALNRDTIGRDENFYIAGGDSLVVAQVIANMREKLEEAGSWEWERLMREMLQTPTVADIAKKLRLKSQVSSADSNKDSLNPVSPLVVLAEGKQPHGPVKVLFHNGTGTLTAYNSLLPYLINDPNRTEKIVGFTFGDEKEYLSNPYDKTIESLGQKYGDLLLQQEASGYKLIGYCIGGLIALETARVLMEAGARVEPVTTISTSFCKRRNSNGAEDEVLLNTIRTSLNNDLLMERAFCRVVGAEVGKAGHNVDDELLKKAISELAPVNGGNITEEALCSLNGSYEAVSECYKKLAAKPQSQRMAEIYAAIEKTNGMVLDYQANMLQILYKVFCHSFKGVAEYEPQLFAGDVYAMRVAEETKHFFPIVFSEVEESWKSVALGDLQFEYIKGAHMTCLQEPHINSTAKFLINGGGK